MFVTLASYISPFYEILMVCIWNISSSVNWHHRSLASDLDLPTDFRENICWFHISLSSIGNFPVCGCTMHLCYTPIYKPYTLSVFVFIKNGNVLWSTDVNKMFQFQNSSRHAKRNAVQINFENTLSIIETNSCKSKRNIFIIYSSKYIRTYLCYILSYSLNNYFILNWTVKKI